MEGTLAWLLAWQNLIFVLPLVFASLLIGAQFLGIAGHGDHDFDGDHDLDLDHEFDGDNDMDHDVDGHDTDQDHDQDGQDRSAPSSIAQVLSLLGVGKVPVTVVLVSFCTIFGATGLTANQVFGGFLPKLPVLALFSVGVAFVTASFLTRYSSMLFGWMMPKSATYVVENEDLVGSVGEALFDINPDFGKVQVRDPYNNLLEVRCRTARESIPQGSQVVLLEYINNENEFLVAPVR